MSHPSPIAAPQQTAEPPPSPIAASQPLLPPPYGGQRSSPRPLAAPPARLTPLQGTDEPPPSPPDTHAEIRGDPQPSRHPCRGQRSPPQLFQHSYHGQMSPPSPPDTHAEIRGDPQLSRHPCRGQRSPATSLDTPIGDTEGPSTPHRAQGRPLHPYRRQEAPPQPQGTGDPPLSRPPPPQGRIQPRCPPRPSTPPPPRYQRRLPAAPATSAPPHRKRRHGNGEAPPRLLPSLSPPPLGHTPRCRRGPPTTGGRGR
ncbi:basic salivary proline-rich protein 4-like [Haliaeetus albicilla]|uniref:basic salivary proline-rich protein 4-like n=1 Tax=Haliaeetus albicilla TaxID=8969 RepID=UPI0037E8F34B